MSKTRWTVVVVALAVAACADGGNADDAGVGAVDARVDPDATVVPDAASLPDAAPPVPDAGATVDGAVPVPDAGEPPDGACNPVVQDCGPGFKCGFVLDDPMSGLGHTGCAVDGTAPLGEACTSPTVAGTSDTCAAGGSCYQSICREICTTVSDTCSEGSCVPFNDIDFDMCLPNCDPIAQDCPGDDACYLLTSGSVCAGVFMDAQPGEPCTAANGCTAGAGCFGDPGTCLRYCSLTVCPPQLDDMGNVVAWCGPEADPPCTCAGGAEFSGMECLATESCQGIMGNDLIGVCAEL